MSIPGVSMEDAADPLPDDSAQGDPVEQDDDDDTLVPTVQVGTAQMVPVGELIKNRKEARTAKRELAEMRTRVERAELVGNQLAEVQPLIEALQRMTPAQRDALATGRMPTPAGVQHDADDVEARETAEDLGLIAADGSLDITRARKIIAKNEARVQAQVQHALGPVKQQTAQQQASVLREQAKGIKDAQGVPLATPESITEAYGMLPAELASQPNVAMVAIGVGMLIDRMKGRTVSAASAGGRFADPIYSEPTGGRRTVAPALTAEEKQTATRLGLSDKELQSAGTALSHSGGRRGISME